MGNRIVWGNETGMSLLPTTTTPATASDTTSPLKPLGPGPGLFRQQSSRPSTTTVLPDLKLSTTPNTGMKPFQPGTGMGPGIARPGASIRTELPGFQQPMIRQPAVMNIIPTAPATTTQPYYDGGGGGGGGSSPSLPPDQPTPTPTPEPTPEYYPVETIPAEIQVPQKTKKDNTWMYVAGGIAVAVGIGGIIAAVYLSKKRK